MTTKVIKPTGVDQGDLVELLHELVKEIIANDSNTAATDFTINIENRAGTITGKDG